MNVPKLRFKNDNGRSFPEWEKKKLSEVTNKIGDGLHGTPVYDENGDYYFINGNNLNNDNNRIELTSNSKRINENEYLKNKIELNKNTILISINGTIGNLAFFNDEKIILGKSAGFFILKDHINKFYFLNLLMSESIKNYFISELTGSTIKNLSLTTLKNTTAFFPCLKEQTKIANFLTAIDDRISQLSQKCEGLAQYKKGVMQKIFSQELRFKDEQGRAFPAWEEKRLGDLYTFKVTNSFSRDNLNYYVGTVKNIHYGDIHTKFSTLFDITKEKVPFINEDIKLDRIKVENYCVEGDVVFADASEDLNDVGKSIEIVNLNGEKLFAGLHTLLARKSGDFFHIGFSGYLFKSNDVRVKIQREAQGSKVLSISATRLVDIKVSIPSKPEQEKIAVFLSAVDEKISHAQAQLDALKQYKQGLLQQMFV